MHFKSDSRNENVSHVNHYPKKTSLFQENRTIRARFKNLKRLFWVAHVYFNWLLFLIDFIFLHDSIPHCQNISSVLLNKLRYVKARLTYIPIRLPRHPLILPKYSHREKRDCLCYICGQNIYINTVLICNILIRLAQSFLTQCSVVYKHWYGDHEKTHGIINVVIIKCNVLYEYLISDPSSARQDMMTPH